jgi:large subunit ribosomal protein L19e
MSLKSQKRLAASLLGAGQTRVWIDPEENERVSAAITRQEITTLINEGRIKLLPKTGISRGRVRARKGRRKKRGSRKGSQKPGKQAWVSKIRAIRRHLRWLRDNRQLSPGSYKTLLLMSKGGAFRSGSHVDEYVKAHQMLKKR